MNPPLNSLKRERDNSSIDSLNNEQQLPVEPITDGTLASSFEQAHVHQVYQAIASHFSSTRYRAWPRVKSFLESLSQYSVVADVGCGNGKYFKCAQQFVPNQTSRDLTSEQGSGEKEEYLPGYRWVIGMDYSEELLQLTKRDTVDPNFNEANKEKSLSILQAPSSAKVGNGVEVMDTPDPRYTRLPFTDVIRSDARQCPLRSAVCDAAISIAVIHHFSSLRRRIEAVRELFRLVKPKGGLFLIYVWALGEEDNTSLSKVEKGDQNESESQRAVRKIKGSGNREINLETGDGLVRWEMNKKFDTDQSVLYRYYHFFKKGELEQLVHEAAKYELDGKPLTIPFTIVDSYYDKENWCVLVKRL